MARTSGNNGGATFADEPRADFYRPQAVQESSTRSQRPARAASDEEADAGEPFLRSRRRVPVRRGILPPWAKTRWGKIGLAAGSVTALAAGMALAMAARNFLDTDPRFRIDSADSIQTVGNSQLSRYDLLSVFGSDIGRNVFFVPLAARRAELERYPWVQRATVMRILPNQLRVEVAERTPIAFVEVGGRIELADSAGVILNMSPQEIAAKHYSFPVVRGINASDPISVRGERMAIYQRFLRDVDSGGEKVSTQLSEVDLSDPEDVRATVTAGSSDMKLQFGQEDFLARWRNYAAHIGQWRAQYPNLAGVDLRYEHEVVLKMAGDAGDGAPAGGPHAASATARNQAQATKPSQPAKAARGRKEQAAKHSARRAR
ncbi:MAG: FtsQ-type POTRA domain-containing protein [Acidobacteriaceae bacterium]